MKIGSGRHEVAVLLLLPPISVDIDEEGKNKLKTLLYEIPQAQYLVLPVPYR